MIADMQVRADLEATHTGNKKRNVGQEIEVSGEYLPHLDGPVEWTLVQPSKLVRERLAEGLQKRLSSGRYMHVASTSKFVK